MSIQVKSSKHATALAGARTVTTRAVVAAAAAAAALFFVYGHVGAGLVRQWLSSDNYSHGFFIPLISLYLVWAKRRRLLKEPIRPSSISGSLLLAGGLIILIVGHAGRNLILQEISLPISLAGLIVILLGRRFLSLLWLPVCYLYFMIPLWSFVVEPLRPAYQNISSRLSAILLTAAGVPVHRDGFLLNLPNITLEVAPQCSGIYYIIAIIAIGIPLAYLYLRSWTRRLILVAAGLLIATFFNGVRIALIGFMSFHGISSVLHGPGHVLQALSVTLVGYIVLFAGVLLLREKKLSEETIIISAPRPSREGFSGCKENTAFTPRFWITIALLALLGLYLQIQTFSPVPLKTSFDLFPDRINEWIETQKESSFDGKNYIEPDDSLSRTYLSREHGRVSLFIGYFEQQELKKKLVNYKIAGLEQRAEIMVLDLGPLGMKKVNTLVSSVNGEPALLLFWYHISGRIIADSRRASLTTAISGLAHGHQNGALVVISQTKPDGYDYDKEQALSNCAALAKSVIPLMDQFVP